MWSRYIKTEVPFLRDTFVCFASPCFVQMCQEYTYVFKCFLNSIYFEHGLLTVCGLQCQYDKTEEYSTQQKE